jgi:hypothetical protein
MSTGRSALALVIQAYQAANIARFFDVYLRRGGAPCAIGTLRPPPSGLTSLERRPARVGSRIAGCGP